MLEFISVDTVPIAMCVKSSATYNLKVAYARWYQECCTRSRYQGQGQVITCQYLWDVRDAITCSCHWYLPHQGGRAFTVGIVPSTQVPVNKQIGNWEYSIDIIISYGRNPVKIIRMKRKWHSSTSQALYEGKSTGDRWINMTESQ